MMKKLIILLALLILSQHSIHAGGEGLKYVEIFDPKQDMVVKEVQLSPEIYKKVTGWVKNINGIYGKIDPVTDDGYAIKLPIEPAIEVKYEYLNTLVNEVYIIIPEKDLPFFMIFENQNKLSCFPFNGDIEALSKLLDFKLKNK